MKKKRMWTGLCCAVALCLLAVQAFAAETGNPMAGETMIPVAWTVAICMLSIGIVMILGRYKAKK